MKLNIVNEKNKDGIDRNEVDRNAMGGTELQGLALTKYVDPALLDKFQIIRSRVRNLDPDKKKILWLHDLPWDPESANLKDPEYRKQFDKIVFVSHWQQQMYNTVLGVPYSEGIVIRNAIDAIPEEWIDKPDDKINIIYHTTPHRGLSLLVPVIEELVKHEPNIHVDIYSSFKLYGWAERDKPFQELFERIKSLPYMTYHGSTSNEEVKKAVGRSHIFAYPSIWQETSCICALEALSAKNLVVTSSLAALPETCANYALMYNYTEDVQTHVNMFYGTLRHAVDIAKTGNAANYLRAQKEYFDRNYDWKVRADEWTYLLNSLL
jgi:glycosyltransferase involved in cell wall biosynthesis